jgi:DNA recombination-dependent growth factor C
MTEEIKIKKDVQGNPAEWLRSFKGCEHYSDEEATRIAESLDILASILLENAAQKLRSNNITVNIDNHKQIERLAA